MIRTIKLKRPFHHDGGSCFTFPLNYCPSMEERVYLIEDGVSIGSFGALHEDIRRRGGGLFSIWNTSIYFSSSNGSDCNTNCCTYDLVLIDDKKLREE